MLQAHFPRASLKVVPTANSVIISGYVDDPNMVTRIIEIAEDYHPRVINNITVGGAQQVMLQIKVMEVSRTKLRTLGIDWVNISGSGDFVASGITGLLQGAALNAGTVSTTGGETFSLGVVDPGNAFFMFLEALRQNNLAKVMAEPNLVTVSGRPAFFNVGGEFPILVPQSLGTVSVEYRRFGTQVDFVPIVLGNGGIRLEVRPRVSEIDNTRSVTINSTNVPGLRVREVDTGVEMRAGQTLAIAGLVQERLEASMRGLPWVSDVPYVGALFRRTQEERNEVELLILVTPQLVEALDCHEVPPCLPGMGTQSPTDWELHLKGRIEVPSSGPCGPGAADCGPGLGGVHGVPGEEVPAGMQSLPAPGGQPPTDNPIESSTTIHLHPGSPGLGGPRRLAPAASRRVQALPAVAPVADRPNRYSPADRARWQATTAESSPPGLIGPSGYDVAQ